MKIFLVNVGANTAHAGEAKSPYFEPDKKFKFVTFPDNKYGNAVYPETMKKFINRSHAKRTHLDPDWHNLTYGENIQNPRGLALKHAERGDLLLFWGLFWEWNKKNLDWTGSTGRKLWGFCGSLLIERIAEPDEQVHDSRGKASAHVSKGRVRSDSRIFFGKRMCSGLFDHLRDFGVGQRRSLLRQTVLARGDKRLEWHSSPRWNSSTRTCRAIADTACPTHHARLRILADHFPRRLAALFKREMAKSVHSKR